MPQRFYVSQVIGTGVEGDFFRPALADAIGSWGADDLRLDDTQATGRMIVWADVTDAQHSALVADVRNSALPFERNNGTALTVADTISSIPSAKRTALRNALENNHIPTDDLVGADAIRKVVSRIIRRIRIRRAMRGDDFAEALGTLVGDIGAQRRQRIADVLQARGYNTGVIQLTDTVRQALQKLAAQDVAWQRNGWD